MALPDRENALLNQNLLSRLTLPPEPPGTGLEGLEMAMPPAPVMKIQERAAAAENVLSKRAEAVPGVDGERVHKLVREGVTGMQKLEGEGTQARLTRTEILGLEAIIVADGSRPVLMVQDGTINLADRDLSSELGRPWQQAAQDRLPGIERVAASVGVIQLPDFGNMRIGTGFAIAPGLILTNRHVLEHIARFFDGAWSWKYRAQIDFCGELDRDRTLTFDLESVVLSGPDPIDDRVDFANLDLAVIRLRAGTAGFPPGLDLGDRADVVKVSPKHRPSIYVVGFPAKPQQVLPGDGRGAAPPGAGTEYEDVLAPLFEDVFAVKRFAPGYVEAGPGQLIDDERKWVMSHDASTLGGNSGSCVVDFSGYNGLVVGLHFGGRARVENWAHVLAALKERFQGVGLQWNGAY